MPLPRLGRRLPLAVLIAITFPLMAVAAECRTAPPAIDPRGQPTPTVRQTAASVRLGQADSGRQVSIGVGESLAVSLEANPSTGYEWIATPNWDESVLELTSKDFTAVSNAPGSQGTEQWLFAGKGRGVTTVKLEYKQPWQRAVEPVRTFSATVSVND